LERYTAVNGNSYQYDKYFNTEQFYVLDTQSIYVFCVDIGTNSDYFPIQL